MKLGFQPFTVNSTIESIVIILWNQTNLIVSFAESEKSQSESYFVNKVVSFKLIPQLKIYSIFYGIERLFQILTKNEGQRNTL